MDWDKSATAVSGIDEFGALGALGVESCGGSVLVTSGTGHRGDDKRDAAPESDFRLDKYEKYEVTVGRFRPFVDASRDKLDGSPVWPSSPRNGSPA